MHVENLAQFYLPKIEDSVCDIKELFAFLILKRCNAHFIFNN